MKVRIFLSDNPSVYDESDEVFTIDNEPAHYLRMTNPYDDEPLQLSLIHI